MERSRNIDFDSDVEFDSLKDAVWRLTTRVYLLEDFIAEKFGEVLTPSGFSKSGSPVSAPGSSVPQTSGENSNIPTGRVRNRRKRRHGGTTSEAEWETIKIQKPLADETFNILESEETDPLSITNIHSLDSEGNMPLSPKNEVLPYDDDSDDYDFMVDRGDEVEDGNDSVAKDPDFIPSLHPDEQSQNPQPKRRERNKHGPVKEKTGIDSGNDNESADIGEMVGVTLVKSQRGGDKIALDGYVYSKTNLKGVVSYWRCEKYKGCPSRAIHSPKGGLEITKEHNHPPDPSRLEVIQLRERVRQLAADVQTPSTALLQKALEGVPPDIASTIKDEVWKRNIRYQRKKATTSTTTTTANTSVIT